MKERPKPEFEVVRQTPYGPELRRTDASRSISPEQTKEPANIVSDESSIDHGRRRFLRVAAATAGATAAAAVGIRTIGGDGSSKEEESTNEPDGALESAPGVPRFEAELSGYRALLALRKDEVLFVDADNEPVGAPQPLTDFIDTKYAGDGSVYMEQYRYTPGTANEAGVLEDGISGEWLAYAKERVAAAHPERSIAGCLHVVGDFKAAYNEADEPELVAGIADGSIATYQDIVDYFAKKPVVGAPEHTRAQYVREATPLRDEAGRSGADLPPPVAAELRRLLPGLCAQESKFNADLTSAAGAQGIFQFMPETWESYGGAPDEHHSLARQTEIAGEFLSDLYGQVTHHMGDAVLQRLRERYADDESFQTDLLVPLTLNAYNAGAARVAAAVREYVANTPPETMPTGKDLFLAIAEYGAGVSDGAYLDAYGPHARSYVPRIYAQADAFADTA